ncbi:MAG: hypothetical protein AAF724_11230 [Pseudomonadota bacterium]
MPQAAQVQHGWAGLNRLLQDEPVFTAGGILMLALILPTMLLFVIDTRTIGGESLWIKPLKFEISLAVFFFTLAVFARFLPPDFLNGNGYRAYAMVIVGCAIAEMIWIIGASAYGTTSHFNTDPFWSAMYGLMGIIATILTSATLVYGVVILRSGNTDPIATAVAVSLILTFFLTIVVAFRLAGNEGNLVGEAVTGHVLPVLGWSREVGDLRVPHFFALHAMQIVPLLMVFIALFAEPLMTRSAAIAVCIAYCIFTLATFAQALNARPFIS